jgi:thiol-disulfide isomerase/thioredoxin
MESKRVGVIVAAVALAVVLVLAFVGYRVLAPNQGETQPAAQSTQPADVSQHTQGQPQQQSQKEALKLADYDATVYTADGQPKKMTEIAAGKPMVINFWATWCPYCVQEMPDFQGIFHDYGEKISFAFVDSTDGRRETKEGAQAWLAENGLDDLPAYYDTDLDATATFGASSLPSTVVVSANGEILMAKPGRINDASMRSALDTLV